ncbi:Hint domain-containing protein [Lentibacter algarum]|uniref:Hint domain-containing protein n=1 Tax=Lentibacter algarum TaxID=576131 RepID=UPI001C081C23|nr:Hint domain-containing protein [Lentibacter algarum]MBU2983057.1 Hint domain-containing protein [Lentibacter algarum]
MFGWKGAGRQKTFRVSEPSGAFSGAQTVEATGVLTGITAGTKIGTAIGWRDAASLQAGDMVLTFDNGLQPLEGVTRRQLWSGEEACPVQFWPLLVPTGVLENSSPIMLLGRQGVMLESDIAEALYGDPFALLPAAALEGLHGIERMYPADPIEVITLEFRSEQVVFGDHGTLLFCSAGGDLLERATAEKPETVGYNMLAETKASQLVEMGVLEVA